MKPAIPGMVFAAAFALAAYQYYYEDNLTSINTGTWWQNGSVTPTPDGLTSSGPNGGSLISKVPVPDGTSEYELRSVLRLVAPGGTYLHYLRASSDAMSGPAAQGTYYSIEFQNPTFSGGNCSMTVAAFKRVNGVVTQLGSTTAACWNGMVLRSVLVGSVIYNYIDGQPSFWFPIEDASIVSGQPGVGVINTPPGNAIQQVKLGPLDRVPPNPVNPQSIGSSLFPNRVDLQWQGVLDNPGASVCGPICSTGTEYSSVPRRRPSAPIQASPLRPTTPIRFKCWTGTTTARP